MFATTPRQQATKVARFLGTNISREGRKVTRLPARIEIHLRKADGSDTGEILYTENISHGGAALSGSVCWHPGERVLIKALRIRFTAEGRIVHCRPAPNGKFAVGLEVISSEGNWPP